MSAIPGRRTGAERPPLFPGNSFNPPRPALAAIRRGFAGRCPACGEGEIFEGYLKRRPHCDACGEAFHHGEPDVLPCLIAIPAALAVGSALCLAIGIFADPPLWLQIAVCEAAAVLVALKALPKANGLTLGLAWAVWLREFDPHERAAAPSKAQSAAPAAASPRPADASAPVLAALSEASS